MNTNKDKYQLVAASSNDGQAVYDMLQDIGRGENGFTNGMYSMSYDMFEAHLKVLIQHAQGRELAPGRVPQTTYWLMRADYPVGTIKLRHYLNDALRFQGGHIGYSIRPSERSKGLGNVMLAKVLEEAKKLGIDKTLLTCYESNTASRRMIERNGGMLEKIESGNCYYWITLLT